MLYCKLDVVTCILHQGKFIASYVRKTFAYLLFLTPSTYETHVSFPFSQGNRPFLRNVSKCFFPCSISLETLDLKERIYSLNVKLFKNDSYFSLFKVQNLAFEPFVKRFLSLWAKCSKSIKLFCKKRRPKLFSNRGKLK